MKSITNYLLLIAAVLFVPATTSFENKGLRGSSLLVQSKVSSKFDLVSENRLLEESLSDSTSTSEDEDNESTDSASGDRRLDESMSDSNSTSGDEDSESSSNSASADIEYGLSSIPGLSYLISYLLALFGL